MDPPWEGRMSEAPASTLMTCAESAPGNRIPQTHSSQATIVKTDDDLTWGDMAKTQNLQKLSRGILSTKPGLSHGLLFSTACSNRKCSSCKTSLAGPSSASQGISTSRSR